MFFYLSKIQVNIIGILTAMQYVWTVVLTLIVDLVEQPPNTTSYA